MDRTTVTLLRLANLSQSRELHFNRNIISSADYNWLKQGPENKPGSHLAASLSGPDGIEKFFEEFQVS